MPIICENCVRGSVLPGTPKGTMITVDSIPTYHAAPETPSVGTPKKAVVLFMDGFGFGIPNGKIQADFIARRLGVDVYVPDQFLGNPPMKAEELEPYETYEAGDKGTWLQTAGFIWLALTRVVPRIFWYGNTPAKASARMRKFVEVLKETNDIAKIGVCGFCYGGIIIGNIADADFISTAVIAHPGNVTMAQWEKIHFPVSFIVAEDDVSFPPKVANEVEAMLAARTGADKVVYEFHEYKGVKHGFAARPAMNFPKIKQAFEDANEQLIAWFEKTL